MSTFLAVLPVVWEDTAIQCLDSMLAPDSSLGLAPEEILVVDNTRDACSHRWIEEGRLQGAPGLTCYRDPDGHNLGTSRSWNIGAQRVLGEGLDYLVILSASMLFGPILHTTFREQIETHAGAPVVEATGHSWHAIAIHRTMFERVGMFDTNLWPAYWEATEWCRRLRLLDLERGWPNVWFNAMSIGHAVHVDRMRWDAPACPPQPLMAYYERKWGAMTPNEVYEHPFNDPSKPIGWFEDVPIPELALRYGIPDGAWW